MIPFGYLLENHEPIKSFTFPHGWADFICIVDPIIVCSQ